MPYGNLIVNAGEVGSGVGGHWVRDPKGFDIYIVGLGDTYSSLADAYLADSNRWAELYYLQSDNWRNNTKRGSRDLAIGDQLYMPDEAVQASGGGAGGSGAVPRSASTYLDPGPQPEPVVPAGMGGSPSPSPSPSPHPVVPVSPPGPVVKPATDWRKILTWGGVAVGAVAVIGIGVAVATSD